MREHVFLCGLSAEQLSEHPAGKALSLEKDVGNLTLKLDRMRRRLAGSEPKRLTDFIEIASYVFAADRTTGRGSLKDPGFGAEWRRDFLLVIAVRDLVFWQRPDVKAMLSETLGFLSEDWWRFDFVENQHPIELQEYLDYKLHEADASGGTSIVLFSGGLDSLAGAVHELLHTNRHVVLVSHRNLPIAGARQVELAGQLAAAHPRRVTHVWVDNSLRFKLTDREATQRTRSFFFTAMAAVAAHTETSDRIRFYENGVMSVNLPIATQVVGARSSRSTHPRSLQLLSNVVHLVSSHHIEIDNPFIWKTKVEVVAELVATRHAPMIRRSLSCTRSRNANKTFQPHCGTCVQCLQRRISTLAGGAGELDESDGYVSDFLVDPREDGPERVMVFNSVSLALDCASISERDFMGRFAEPVAWVLQAYPVAERDGITKKVIDIYWRHGAAVHSILIDAAKPQLPGVFNRTLPPSSLLALVLASRLGTTLPLPVEPPPVGLPEPPPDRVEADITSDEVLITVDDARQRILISDRAELHGSAIFPIMKLLIELSMNDRAHPTHRKNYRGLRAKVIANQLPPLDEVAVRAAIKRARAELADADSHLYGKIADPNSVIESIADRGYRLNPMVVVLSLEEFRRR